MKSKYANKSYAFMKVDKLLSEAKQVSSDIQMTWEYNYPSRETDAASSISELIKALEKLGFGEE